MTKRIFLKLLYSMQCNPVVKRKTFPRICLFTKFDESSTFGLVKWNSLDPKIENIGNLQVLKIIF